MTNKQREANRRNAKGSTGPKTQEGKAKSSKNGIKHGGYSQAPVLPSENPEDREKLRSSLDDQFDPQTPTELELVSQLATFQWQLHRVTGALDQMLLLEPLTAENFSSPHRLCQFQLQLQRAYSRVLKDLNQIRSLRLKAAKPQNPAISGPLQPEYLPGLIWRHPDGQPWEAACPRLRYPDEHVEPLYPGDPRRKQFGWNFEPDREHSIEWDPNTDPLPRPDKYPAPKIPRPGDPIDPPDPSDGRPRDAK
jgi:hypothetical protein